MPMNELFPQGAIKSFEVGIGWIIMEPGKMFFLLGGTKMVFEFADIIGLEMTDGKRGYAEKAMQEIGGGRTGTVRIRQGKAKPGLQINGGNDVSFQSLDKDKLRVHLDEIPWYFGKISFPA